MPGPLDPNGRTPTRRTHLREHRARTDRAGRHGAARALAIGIGLAALLTPASSAVAVPADLALTFTHVDGSLRVGGNDCGPNEPNAPGGVRLTVTSHFEGTGHAPSARVVLVQSATFDSNSLNWTYLVPQPFVAVPSWADAEVVVAKAHCFQAIQDGYDYPTAELRRPIRREGAPTTTTTSAAPVAPGTTPAPTPATPVSDTATFTG